MTMRGKGGYQKQSTGFQSYKEEVSALLLRPPGTVRFCEPGDVWLPGPETKQRGVSGLPFSSRDAAIDRAAGQFMSKDRPSYCRTAAKT